MTKVTACTPWAAAPPPALPVCCAEPPVPLAHPPPSISDIGQYRPPQLPQYVLIAST